MLHFFHKQGIAPRSIIFLYNRFKLLCSDQKLNKDNSPSKFNPTVTQKIKRPNKLMNFTSVIIPTYNEKALLQSLVNMLESIFHEHNINAEIIFVDDNSPDGTGKIADELAEKYCNIKVIHRQKKLGLGSAYKMAVTKAVGDTIVTMDADLSHNPKELPKLLDPLRNNEADIIIGSRYLLKKEVENWPIQRRLISKIGNILAKKILKLELYDVTSGFRVYKRCVINQTIRKISSNGFFFQVEIIYHAKNDGFQVVEKEITFTDRQTGKSNLTLKECIYFFISLIRLKKRERICDIEYENYC